MASLRLILVCVILRQRVISELSILAASPPRAPPAFSDSVWDTALLVMRNFHRLWTSGPGSHPRRPCLFLVKHRDDVAKQLPLLNCLIHMLPHLQAPQRLCLRLCVTALFEYLPLTREQLIILARRANIPAEHVDEYVSALA